jgi:hypothetical protein
MQRARLLARLGTLVLLSIPASALGLTLDSFTDPLPQNPCLPVSGQRVVFTGLYCDGVSCPPGSMVYCAENDVLQTGLAGALGGRRQTGVFNWVDETVHARIDPPTQTLLVGFEGTSESGVEVAYGTPGDPYPQPDALDLDLPGSGVESLRLVVGGDISPSKPLLVYVFLLSDGPVIPRPGATATRILDQPGIVTIPLADFVPDPGFTLSDVDDIQVGFSNCLDFDNGCSSETVYASQQFSLGPIEFVTNPTPTQATSWGQIKAIYR